MDFLPVRFLTKQSSRDVEVVADFAGPGELETVGLAIKGTGEMSKAQKSACGILRCLLWEVDYYRRNQSLARNEMELLRHRAKGISEMGTVLVFRVEGKVAGAAMIHSTWKGNVYLDWMATLPDFMKPERKIMRLGWFMLQAVLQIAWRLGANLVFIESTKGAA